METEVAKRRFTDLLCYMAASAHGCIGEPPLYGPFRLADCMERLLGILDEIGWSDAFLNHQREVIAEKKLLVVESEEMFIRFLDTLAMGFAARLKDH